VTASLPNAGSNYLTARLKYIRQQLAEVQQLINEGQWQQAQDKLQTVTTTVATVNDVEQKQQLVTQWQDLTVKVDAKDPNATLPPGVPPERVEALRKAFLQTLNDKNLRAEADKMQLDVDPMSGDELQKLVADLYDTPPRLVERARQALTAKAQR